MARVGSSARQRQHPFRTPVRRPPSGPGGRLCRGSPWCAYTIRRWSGVGSLTTAAGQDAYADNLAVWRCRKGRGFRKAREVGLNAASRSDVVPERTLGCKPPYLPSPTDAPEMQETCGRRKNLRRGNPSARCGGVAAPFELNSVIGEDRVLLRLQRYDWLGNEEPAVVRKDIP